MVMMVKAASTPHLPPEQSLPSYKPLTPNQPMSLGHPATDQS